MAKNTTRGYDFTLGSCSVKTTIGRESVSWIMLDAKKNIIASGAYQRGYRGRFRGVKVETGQVPEPLLSSLHAQLSAAAGTAMS